MANKSNDPKPAAPADAPDEALRALEEANASLAARVAELESELAAAREAHAVTAMERDRHARDVSELHEALSRRGDSGRASPDDELRRTRRALEIGALVKLHVEGRALGVTDERAVSVALRLGQALCDDVDACGG